MKVYSVVGGAVVLGTVLPIAVHYAQHGVLNAVHCAMSFFLWLNTIVSFWEIALCLEISLIERQFADFKERYKGRELDRIIDLFLSDVSWSQVFKLSTWAEIWSSYSVFDESYASRKSFGFFIDVGNGFSTLLPTLICLLGVTFHVVPARALGILMVVLNWQMFYGTVIYFTSYIFNKRYVGHTVGNVCLFVGVSNGLWFTFPLVCIWAGIQLIYADSFTVFL